MTAAPLSLKFQIGARTVATLRRRLARVALSLDDVLEGRMRCLPPLDGDGYLVTSLPEALMPGFARHGLLTVVRQRYTRFHADLGGGHEAWLAGLSGSARSALKRKTKKLAALSGGTLDVRAYRTAADLATFHPIARALSAKTYQERLLGSGLPADGESIRHLYALAGDDMVRAWLLFVGDAPAAYLCCTADGSALRYDHVGHDPALAALSPGTVLQAEAMRALFADRFSWFDFTEGEGQHKRLFATGGTRCVDLLLLRPTPGNRAAAAALSGFDAAIALAKRASGHPLLARIAKRVRR